MNATYPPVTLELEETGTPPGRWPSSPTDYGRSYYRATLIYRGRRASFPFSTGSAWDREPVAREVLESVLSEANTAEDVSSAEELAHEWGESYDTGAERKRMQATYRAIAATGAKVRRLLGDDYDAAVSDPAGWPWLVTDEPPDWISDSERDRNEAASRWSGPVGTTADGEPVRVTVELRRDDAGPVLSITGSTPHSGGQIFETVRAIAADGTPAAGWTREELEQLADDWQRWHLNNTRAGCEHQRAAGWTYDTHRDESPDAPPYAGLPCPECGYRIGSAWLYEELPAELLERLARRFNVAPPELEEVAPC